MEKATERFVEKKVGESILFNFHFFLRTFIISYLATGECIPVHLTLSSNKPCLTCFLALYGL